MADQDRTTPERLADHERIQQLAEELLPELAGRLAAGGLGEIEIREDGWRIRVRRPAGAPHRTEPRRGPDRTRTAGAGAGGHGHVLPVGSGTAASAAAADRDGHSSAASAGGHRIGEHRIVATSPAVGIFQTRPEVHSGSRVRSGDRLAIVDLLGVPQDVIAPSDGVVVETLADNGEGVEYGQDLVVIELVGIGLAPSGQAS